MESSADNRLVLRSEINGELEALVREIEDCRRRELAPMPPPPGLSSSVIATAKDGRGVWPEVLLPIVSLYGLAYDADPGDYALLRAIHYTIGGMWFSVGFEAPVATPADLVLQLQSKGL